MKILLIFTLCLISDGGESKEVTGYSGGGVLITCKYETKYTQNQKYSCKGSWSVCSDQIKTRDKNEWINSGRLSLFDETKSAEFRVMIRELTVQDTGTYYCGVDISYGLDSYTPVELKIKEDPSYMKSINESVHAGGGLNISFKYPESLRSNPKFLCKRLQSANCSYNVSKSRKCDGNFFLFDDQSKQILTVSIRNVSEQDSGEYWCGAEVSWTSDDGYKVYFTRINLTVTGLPSSSPPRSSPPPSSSSGFPASTAIIVSVILLLLLIGILVLLVIVKKTRKIKAGKTSVAACSVPENSYEEVKDTRQRSALQIVTVYSAAQLPTIPSAPPQPVHSNTFLPKSPCDPPLYSAAQLPTIPSDQDLYSTAQLPTSL